jgi:hypothetical protein
MVLAGHGSRIPSGVTGDPLQRCRQSGLRLLLLWRYRSPSPARCLHRAAPDKRRSGRLPKHRRLEYRNDLADIWRQRGAAPTRLVNHCFARSGLCFGYRVIPIEDCRTVCRPHDASPTRELPAVEGVPVTRPGRQAPSTRIVHWLVPAATDISKFLMIRQSIDSQSCSTTPLRDLMSPRATIFSRRSASRSKSSGVISRVPNRRITGPLGERPIPPASSRSKIVDPCGLP